MSYLIIFDDARQMYRVLDTENKQHGGLFEYRIDAERYVLRLIGRDLK